MWRPRLWVIKNLLDGIAHVYLAKHELEVAIERDLFVGKLTRGVIGDVLKQLDYACTCFLTAEKDRIEQQKSYKGPHRGSEWFRARQAALERDDGRCQFPGCNETEATLGRNMHVHHIVPISQGGTHDLDNLVCLCPKHHNKCEGHPELLGKDGWQRGSGFIGPVYQLRP